MNGRSKVGYKNSPVPTISKEPARLISDQLITIFFQEWAPLFPVLHQPSFLNLYNKYVNNPEALVNQQSIALLNLVFSIAAISAEVYPELIVTLRQPLTLNPVESPKPKRI